MCIYSDGHKQSDCSEVEDIDLSEAAQYITESR